VGTPDVLLTALWDSDKLLLELDAALTVTGRYTGTPDAWGGLVSQWQQAQLVDRWNSPSSFYSCNLAEPLSITTNASKWVHENRCWQIHAKTSNLRSKYYADLDSCVTRAAGALIANLVPNSIAAEDAMNSNERICGDTQWFC
jgi:hypothetical protein